jgi:5-methylthioadenosine/S-adenosylhomocysteine deaminase
MNKTVVDILVLHGTVITMDSQRRIIADGGVAITENKITAVGIAEDIKKQYHARDIIEVHGHAILPGFINGHVHSAMNLLRGTADDLPLEQWLCDKILPLESALMSDNFVATGTELAIIEMLRSGITTAVDMYHLEDVAAQAFADYGMRALVGYTIADQPDRLRVAGEFVMRWKEHPYVRPVLAPHSLYAVPQQLLHATRDLAESLGVPLMMHFAETATEIETLRMRYGLTPCQLLVQNELLAHQLILAHVVHVTEDELQQLAPYHLGIVHCPTSNMKLASGIAPVTTMLAHQLRVGLGTDSAASNNTLNMFAEMKTAALLQSVTTRNAHALNAQTALELATIRGAQALHAEKYIGSIEEGKFADIITVSLEGIHQLPAYDIVSTLVYASYPSDVQYSLINGVVKLRAGKLCIDEYLLKQLHRKITAYRRKIELVMNR